MRGLPSTRNQHQLPVFLGEGFKIVAMGMLLALVLFAFFFADGRSPDTQPEYPVYEPRIVVPVVDHQILATARDGTRSERLILEPEPFRHLLEASLDVVPGVARQLGRPREPLDVDELSANPSIHRGKYLWSAGELLDLSGPIQGHPVEGYDYYEGRLRTPESEIVTFAFSLPVSRSIEIGDWVRVEGFFLKLRDSHFPQLEMAPMLVGRSVVRDYPAWDPVQVIDPGILAQVRDGGWADGYYEGEDSDLTLEESQDVPLWHLASYAVTRKDTMGLTEWRKVPALVETDQWVEIMRGDVPKGTPMRVLGECLEARVIEAAVNPVGIADWSEVLVQVHGLGGAVIPVWIPERVDFARRRFPVELRTYLFKRHAYDNLRDQRRHTPVFVAATLTPYETVRDPIWTQIGWVAVGLASLLIGVFYLMARRDRLERAQHEEAMVERRRRRRKRLFAAGQG